jgi:hypothetical protein
MEWTKLIPIILIIISFSVIIYFIVRSFQTTCQDGYEFNDKLNKCVPKCDAPFIINADGTKCVCPEGKIEKDRDCIKDCKGDTPLLCGTDNCYSDRYFNCIDGKLCSVDPSQSCGLIDTNGVFRGVCCEPKDGKNYSCSNRKIIFSENDSFTVGYSGKIYTIEIPVGNYNVEQQDPKNYFTYLQNLLNNAVNSKLFTVNSKTPISKTDTSFILYFKSDDKSNQVTFDFTNTNNLSNFGINKDNKKLTFNTSNLDLSSPESIQLYTCVESPCEKGEIFCGNKCCPEDNCINGVCCDLNTSTICNGNCCPNSEIDNKSNCCGSICCPKDQVCIDGVCKIKCYNNDINNNPLYCSTGTNQCDSEECINITKDGKSYSYCSKKGCVFLENKYTPSNDNYDNPLCRDKVNGHDYFCIPPGYTGTLTRNVQAIVDDSSCGQLCNLDDCLHRINDVGVIQDSISLKSDDTLSYCLGNFECTGQNGVLKPCPIKTLINLSIICPFDDNRRCCIDDNGYLTGQVCTSDEFPVARFNNEKKYCDCTSKTNTNQSVKLRETGYDPCIGISCEKRLPYIYPTVSNGNCLCSIGYGLYEYDNKHGKYCSLISDPNPSGPIVQPKPTIDGATYQTFEECNKNTGCYPGYTGDKCENIINPNSFTNDQIINLLNKLQFIQNVYSGDFKKFFDSDSFPYANYVLVYCLNDKSEYRNFCSNGGKNYYTEGTTIHDFHNSIFGENKGDLVFSESGLDVAFWWNNIECSEGNYGPYISVNPNGLLNPESSLGNTFKFYPNIAVTFIPGYNIPSSSGTIFVPPVYKNLGVLLIGPTK